MVLTATESDGVAAQYRTMQEIVTEQLRSAILAGRLGPGDRLSQDDLARQLGVSRMPVREALRTLESEGLVVLRPHRPAVVVSLREEDIHEIYGIRALLEARAAALAAPQLSDETLTRLRELHAEMDTAMRQCEYEREIPLNREFHRTLYAACGWPRLLALIEAQLDVLAPYRRMWASSLGVLALAARLARVHKEHAKLLAAAEVRDAERLERLIADHILATGHELSAFLAAKQTQATEHPEAREGDLPSAAQRRVKRLA